MIKVYKDKAVHRMKRYRGLADTYCECGYFLCVMAEGASYTGFIDCPKCLHRYEFVDSCRPVGTPGAGK